MATEMPGRQVINDWATFLNIDISDAMAKADQILADDPDAMMVGGDQLASIMESLRNKHQNAAQVGTDLMPGWSGASAETFVPKVAELGQNAQQTTDSLAGVRQNLTSIAEDCTGRINAVCNASAVTAAFLGTQAAAAQSAAPTAM
jgi:uncharacterized protein YukE